MLPDFYEKEVEQSVSKISEEKLLYLKEKGLEVSNKYVIMLLCKIDL